MSFTQVTHRPIQSRRRIMLELYIRSYWHVYALAAVWAVVTPVLLGTLIEK